MKSKRLEQNCVNYLLHFYKFVDIAELVCSLVWRFLCRSLYISSQSYCKVSEAIVQPWLGSNT